MEILYKLNSLVWIRKFSSSIVTMRVDAFSGAYSGIFKGLTSWSEFVLQYI